MKNSIFEKLKRQWSQEIAAPILRDMVSRGRAEEMCGEMFDRLYNYLNITAAPMPQDTKTQEMGMTQRIETTPLHRKCHRGLSGGSDCETEPFVYRKSRSGVWYLLCKSCHALVLNAIKDEAGGDDSVPRVQTEKHMTHDLKIWPQYYEAVASGKKTFELRTDDRNFQSGDLVTLRWFDPEWKFPNPLFTEGDMRGMWDKEYPPLTFKIGYILPVPQSDNQVIFSLLQTL